MTSLREKTGLVMWCNTFLNYFIEIQRRRSCGKIIAAAKTIAEIRLMSLVENQVVGQLIRLNGIE